MKPTLEILVQYFDVLTTDGVVSHRFLVDVMNIEGRLKKQFQRLQGKIHAGIEDQEDLHAIQTAMMFVDGILTKMNELLIFERLVKGILMICSLLHPCYKGVVVLDAPRYREFCDEFVKMHSNGTQRTQVPSLLERYTQEELDEMSVGDLKMLEFELHKDSYFMEQGKDLPPLRKELQQYLAVASEPSDVDVLKWWRNHKRQFPIMAKLARQYLPFSVTATHKDTDTGLPGLKRWLSDESNPVLLHKLVFIQANAGRLPMDVNSWTYMNIEVRSYFSLL
jgi:hAT family C-terminal dimerisation region